MAKAQGNGFPGDEGYDESEWEHFAPVVEDSGVPIDWERTPEFFGTFKGYEIRQSPSLATGELEDTYLLKFKGRDGEDYSTFANYVLCKAFVPTTVDGKNGGEPDDVVKVGERVRITNKGKKSIGNGQTMNRMSVDVAGRS